MFAQRLYQAAQHVSALGYYPAYVSLHGSQNYGLSIHTVDYQSDYDFKCVVLPSLWELVEGKRPVSTTVETPDGQIDIKDIRVYMDALERMNPAYLESLSTGYCLIVDNSFENMRAMLPDLMRERAVLFAKACEGLFEDKARRMCHDSPAVREKIEKFGYDGKQPHHMYRLLLQLRAFESTGEFVLKAPDEAHELLMELKMNRIPLHEVWQFIDTWRPEMRAIRQRIEEKSCQPTDDACRKIRRIAQEMMYAHCRKAGEQGA